MTQASQTMKPQHAHLDEETLIACLQNRLSDQARRSVEAHLRQCDACRQALDDLRQLQRQLQAHYAAHHPAPETWQQVQARIEAHRDKVVPLRKPASSARRWTWLGATAAAVLFAVQLVLIQQADLRQQTGYAPLGASQHERLHIWVRFAPSADSRTITTLLRHYGLILDSGPDSAGRYRLALPAGADEQTLQRTLKALRQRPEIAEALLP